MALGAAQLIPRIRQRLALTTDDALASDAFLLQDLNDALTDFAAEKDWPWLEKLATISLTEGTGQYSLPADCTRIHELSIGAFDPLDAQQYRDVKRWQNGAAGEGRPSRYCTVGNTILVAPLPDTAYTLDIFYQAPETVLTLIAGAIVTPDYVADVVVTFGALHAAIRLRDQALISSLAQLKTDQVQRTWDQCETDSRAVRISTRNDTREGWGV